MKFKKSQSSSKTRKSILPFTLTIQKGEIVGLLGENGASKPTLLRAIFTSFAPGTAIQGSVAHLELTFEKEIKEA